MALRVDTTPLKASRPFRALFASRTITLAGSQATAVALLVQAKDLTGSAIAVGLIGVAELVPLNAARSHPATWPLYAGAAAIMALTALQRPSLDAAVPRVVDRDQLAAASAL